MLLRDQTAFVTGAGRGIGRGVALAFAAQGCAVACVARTESELNETVRTIAAAGGSAMAVVCDVTQPDAVQRAVQRTLDAWGRIDILVNNAGHADFKPFVEMTVDDWSRTLDVNLMSVVHCMQAVIPGMKAQGGGRIINISSVAGLKPIPEQSAYVAAKHGLNGLSKTLAMELQADNIRVQTVCPGGVDTRLAREAMPERDKSGWMTPDDIAHACLFLATQSERAVTDELTIRRVGSKPVGG